MTAPTHFYALAARRALLTQAADAWEGTPFHPRVCILGRGAQCHGLLQALNTFAGVPGVAELELPSAPMRHHEFSSESIVQNFMKQLLKHKRIERLELSESPDLLPGDILGLKVGQTVHHLCQLITPERAIHVDRKKGVLYVMLTTLRPYLQTAYRIL